MGCYGSPLAPGDTCLCYRHRKNGSRSKSALWRAAARGAKVNGDLQSYQRYARTAAIIEGRPWKVDRGSL